MRYFPRLKLFKASNNTFDGQDAYSYEWYRYATKLNDGSFVMVERSYGPTTSKHMYRFRSLIGYETKIHRVLAPNGLQDSLTAIEAIKYEISKIELELTNKRNRKIEARKSRIAELKGQLEIVALMVAERNSRNNIKQAA